MIIKLLSLSFSLSYCLALIGNTLYRKTSLNRRLDTFIFRDADIGKEIFPEDSRKNVLTSHLNAPRSHTDLRFKDNNSQERVKSVKLLNKDFKDSFISKCNSLTNNREFAQFLKSTAQKRTTLTQSDRQHVVDELLHRVSHMSVHIVSDVLWSLGTLKIPIKQTVRPLECSQEHSSDCSQE